MLHLSTTRNFIFADAIFIVIVTTRRRSHVASHGYVPPNWDIKINSDGKMSLIKRQFIKRNYDNVGKYWLIFTNYR